MTGQGMFATITTATVYAKAMKIIHFLSYTFVYKVSELMCRTHFVWYMFYSGCCGVPWFICPFCRVCGIQYKNH